MPRPDETPVIIEAAINGETRPERKPSNREIVEQAAALVAEVGRPVATTADAARLLALPASA